MWRQFVCSIVFLGSLLAIGSEAAAQLNPHYHGGLGSGGIGASRSAGLAVPAPIITAPAAAVYSGGVSAAASAPDLSSGSSRSIVPLADSQTPILTAGIPSGVFQPIIGFGKKHAVEGMFDQAPRVNYGVCVSSAFAAGAGRELMATPHLLRTQLFNQDYLHEKMSQELQSSLDRDLFQCQRNYYDQAAEYCLESPTLAEADGYNCGYYLRAADCRRALQGKDILRAPNTLDTTCTDEDLWEFFHGESEKSGK